MTTTVASECAGQRLDAVAARLFESYSRNRLQSWISEGFLTVDGQTRRARDRLLGGEQLRLQLPPDMLADLLAQADAGNISQLVPEPIPLDVVHEDAHIMVINKPARLVMHPAPGNLRGTLLNGLLHYRAEQGLVPRAGIVHRLDKDTSGLCVIARTLAAHTHLVRQLQTRTMGRTYLALVIGDVPIEGTIDEPIGRHPKDRKRMAVVGHGKPSVTYFQCDERYLDCALVRVRLATGRTHQIRVHMTHIGHPLIGDPTYGRRLAVLPRSLAQVPAVASFTRQALHATRLELVHPASEERLGFDAPLPEDMQQLCTALREVALRRSTSQP